MARVGGEGYVCLQDPCMSFEYLRCNRYVAVTTSDKYKRACLRLASLTRPEE
jgi:hypothetical protein